MLVKFNNFLINIEKHWDLSRTAFCLSSQSFYIIQVKNDYDDEEEVKIVYCRTLSEWLSNSFSFFIAYYNYYDKFELSCLNKEEGFSDLLINYSKEEYSDFSKLFKQLYNAYKI